MKGDFSRLSFNPARGFSRVLHQQGRVTLDADTNEQQSINLHLMRSLAADLIGQHGGSGGGFLLSTPGGAANQLRLTIAAGRYYVDGWLCENAADVDYHDVGVAPPQPWLRDAPAPTDGTHLVVLEVFERHVAAAEIDRAGHPTAPDALREVALEGPDTASRAQLVWQVKLHPLAGVVVPTPLDDVQWAALVATWWAAARGQLKAKAMQPRPDSGDPCIVSPQSRYRGIENQLYRVEIIRGGGGTRPGASGQATFAWSRENGAVVFPVEAIAGQSIKLADVWRDARFAIAIDEIVEVADDTAGLVAPALPPELRNVTGYDPDTATVTLDKTPSADTDDPRRPVLLRRWDHGGRNAPAGSSDLAPDNALRLVEDKWLKLEEGVEVFFDPGTAAERPVYRSGDYWLIPARVALGDVLWPRDADLTKTPPEYGPMLQPPHGVERHFAPLGIVSVTGGAVNLVRDLRRTINPLAPLV